MSQGVIKSFYYSKWFILVILIIIVFFLISAVKDYYSQEDLRDDISTLESQISNLQDEQYNLSATLSQVQGEDFVENEARTKLNLRKPGENIIIVSNDKDIQEFYKNTVDTGIKNLLSEQESNFSLWWKYFFPIND